MVMGSGFDVVAGFTVTGAAAAFGAEPTLAAGFGVPDGLVVVPATSGLLGLPVGP
jgi:hypothetical protein